jgi:hypothetical protein
MSMLPNASPKRQLPEQVTAVLVYLGIVTTFATVSLILCTIWLLVWRVAFREQLADSHGLPHPTALN